MARVTPLAVRPAVEELVASLQPEQSTLPRVVSCRALSVFAVILVPVGVLHPLQTMVLRSQVVLEEAVEVVDLAPVLLAVVAAELVLDQVVVAAVMVLVLVAKKVVVAVASVMLLVKTEVTEQTAPFWDQP